MASWCYTANERHNIKCKIGRKTCNCLQMECVSMYNHTKSVITRALASISDPLVF